LLTQRGQQVLNYIKRYKAHYHIAPTVREIAEGIGIRSRGVAYRYLYQLQQAGYINLWRGHKRNIELIEDQSNTNQLKLIGQIVAGEPIEAVPEPDQINLDSALGGQDRFALRVKGNSMEQEGILDGDIVVCQYTNQPQNGHIVVALIDGSEATLKHFSIDNQYIKLSPAHANMDPLYYARERVQIQGIMVGLIRLNAI